MHPIIFCFKLCWQVSVNWTEEQLTKGEGFVQLSFIKNITRCTRLYNMYLTLFKRILKLIGLLMGELFSVFHCHNLTFILHPACYYHNVSGFIIWSIWVLYIFNFQLRNFTIVNYKFHPKLYGYLSLNRL